MGARASIDKILVFLPIHHDSGHIWLNTQIYTEHCNVGPTIFIHKYY